MAIEPVRIPIRDIVKEASTVGPDNFILVDDGIGMAKAKASNAIDKRAKDVALQEIDDLNLGSAAQSDVGDFATSAQGALAESAVQPDDLAPVATSGDYGDLNDLPTLGTAAATDASDYATSEQGLLANSSLQPEDVGSSVQAHSAFLDALAGMEPGSSGQVIAFDESGEPEAVTVDTASAVSYLPQGLTELQGLQAQHNIGQPLSFKTVADLLSEETLSYDDEPGKVTVGPGDVVEAGGFRYEVAASGAVDAHMETAGGVRLLVVSEPGRLVTGTPSGWIGEGALIRRTRVDGSWVLYRAIRTFEWTSVNNSSPEISHGYSADPDMVVVETQRTDYAPIPAPTGMTPPPFTVRSVGRNRVATSLDSLNAYRSAYMPPPARVLHCDIINGNNSSDGLTRNTAKRTLRNGGGTPLITTANAGEGNVLVYLYGADTAYGRTFGLTAEPSGNNGISMSHAYIGVNDAEGNPPILSNGYEEADVSWSSVESHPWVWQTETTIMTQPHRVFDMKNRRAVTHPVTGKRYNLPLEYTRLSSLEDVAALPGSYWFDSSSSLFYVNCLGGRASGGGAPLLNVDLIITSTAWSIDITMPSFGGDHVYFENIIFLSGVRIGKIDGKAYFSDCVSLGSRINGVNALQFSDFGTRNMVVLDAQLDGMNYHVEGGSPATFHEINPYVDNVGVFQSSGSHQCSSAHSGHKGWTTNPNFSNGFLDNIRDIDTCERIVYGGTLSATRPDGDAQQGQVWATQTAKMALYDVSWGGRLNGSAAILRGNSTNPLKLLHTAVPSNGRFYALTDDW